MREPKYFTASTLNGSLPSNFVQAVKDAHKRIADEIIRESLELTEFDLWKGCSFRNPFDFMTETDQWFEWKWRTMFGKERTCNVIIDMVKDKKRISKCVEVNFTVLYQYQPSYAIPPVIYPTA
ncbi:hypothetical protein SH449x_000766 [Pirellulaceae bacterium SH449]